MSNFYVGEVLFETGGTIDTPGDINVTAICDCTGSVGTAGQLLSSTGTALEWITGGSGGIPCSLLTAAGDLITATAANTPFALGVGTDGQILTACSACSSGLTWVTATGGSAATALALGTVYGCTGGTTAATVSFGYNAASSAAGTFNTFIGAASGRLSSSGTGNTAVGRNALCGSATATNNVAIGMDSLLNANAGNSNVAVGQGTMGSATGSCNVVIGTLAGGATFLTSGSNNVLIGSCVQAASASGSCQLAIGYTCGQYWLTGTSTKAIKPGAGIIDCANSCGNNGQVLMSNGSNAICWGSITQCTGTVTSVVAGTGLTGGTITTTGTIALDTTCVIQPSAFTAKGALLSASAAATPVALTVGTEGQVLIACPAAASGLCWGAVPSGPAATPSARGIVYGCTTDAHPTSGTGDVALGLNAYCSVTTGYANTAIGGDALGSVSSGCNNVGIGDQAGYAITTESNNVVVGANSVLNGGMSNSVVVGASIDGNFAGDENLIAGFSSLSPGTSGTAVSCSVILGGCALTSTNQVGSNLIGIGHKIAMPNSNGSTQLAIGNFNSYWLSGDSNYAIKPGAGIIDCAGSCGTVGQVLCSNGSNAVQWATPQTSPYVTHTTSAVPFTAGTPLLVAIWGGGTIQGTVTAPTQYNSNFSFWDFYLSGDATNLNTNWFQTATWPVNSSDPGYLGSWSINFPVYPDPNANQWEIYFNPAANSLNDTAFTFFYRPLPGTAAINWQI